MRRLDPRPFLALAIALVTPPALGRADEVDEIVEKRMKAGSIPGLSLAVVKDGRVVKRQGYGKASVELECPADAATVYEIGSITKMFTATAVMMLVEEGKLGLDDPIRKHLPDLPEGWDAVTVRQLLNHTSGIKSYTGVGDFLKLARTDHAPDDILKIVRDLKPDFDPGAKWSYNNTGYYLLGLLVEKRAEKSYASVLEERIFKPLDMTSTRPSNPTAIIAHRAHGYARLLGVLVNRDPITPSAAFSAGFLLSDLDDLVKWDAALAEGKLLSSESYAQMYRPARLADGTTHPYGFGWAIGERLGHKILEHGGGTPGFSTLLRRYPDDRLTVIVLTNLGGADTGGVANVVARHYLPALDVANAEPAPDPDPERTAKLKAGVEAILAGKLEDAPLTPEFAKFLDTAPAKAMSKAINAEGPLASFTLLKAGRRGDRTTLDYRATVGKATYVLAFVLDDQGRIAGLRAQKED